MTEREKGGNKDKQTIGAVGRAGGEQKKKEAAGLALDVH